MRENATHNSYLQNSAELGAVNYLVVKILFCEQDKFVKNLVTCFNWSSTGFNW